MTLSGSASSNQESLLHFVCISYYIIYGSEWTLFMNSFESPSYNVTHSIHSGRSDYIDLLLIKMAVVAMFQENWSQIKIPSTN